MKTRAMAIGKFGGPEVLHLREVDVARTSVDDVLLRVLAVSVNHLDVDLREGTSRMNFPFPHVLGREVVGEILEAATSAHSSPVRTGDRVLVLPNAPCGRCALCQRGRPNLCPQAYMPGITGWGGYADHIVVPARSLLPIGDLDPIVAAATPISFGTAWRMLYSLGRLSPSDAVLVSGAAGGLGHAAVQLAVLGGARVVGLVGDPAKMDFVSDCGAAAVISTRDEDWPSRALEESAGRGFDLVVEHVGGELFEHCVNLLAPTGRLMVGGGHADERPRLDVIAAFRGELQILGTRSQRPDEILQVLALAAIGRVRPRIDRVLPMVDAAEAHRAISARTVRGKQVLVP